MHLSFQVLTFTISNIKTKNIMKTLHTSRGVAFDAEIAITGSKSITVEVTCEEGSKNFDFEYPYDFDNAMITAIDSEDFDYLIDDFTEIYNFVDSSVIGEISRQASEICLLIADDKTTHANFVLHTLNTLSLSIFILDINLDEFEFNAKNTFTARGTEEINELLKKLRNGI